MGDKKKHAGFSKINSIKFRIKNIVSFLINVILDNTNTSVREMKKKKKKKQKKIYAKLLSLNRHNIYPYSYHFFHIKNDLAKPSQRKNGFAWK